MPDESRPMYKAVCANCGKSCEVPFRPSGDRPVYCRDCFRARSEGGGGAPKQGGASATSSSPRPSSQGAPRPSDGLSAQVSAMSTKLDRLLALMQESGIEDCGNAQNCVKVCPKGIPLVASIIETNREISLNLLHLLKK